MVDLFGGIDYDKIKIIASSGLTTAKIVDSAGNIVSDIPLSSLRPARSESVRELSSQSISASGKAEFEVTDTEGYSAIAVSIRAVYNASATAGVRVRWLYSPDGVNYDSENGAENESQYQDIAFTAGATEQETVIIPIFQPYVKVQIVNLDTAESVTVSAWRTLMR